MSANGIRAISRRLDTDQTFRNQFTGDFASVSEAVDGYDLTLIELRVLSTIVRRAQEGMWVFDEFQRGNKPPYNKKG